MPPATMSYNTSSNENQGIYPEVTSIDEVSLKAAKEWLAMDNGSGKSTTYFSEVKRREIEQSVRLLTDHTTIVNQRSNNVQNRRPAEDIPVRGLDLRAISRYVVFLLMFAQGSSPTKIALYTSLSIVYYAVESGLLHFILQKFVQDDMEEEGSDGIVAAENNGIGGGSNERRRGFAHRLIELSRDGIPVTLPTNPGISRDVYSFTLSFVMSLSPHWQPESAPAPVAAVNPPLF